MWAKKQHMNAFVYALSKHYPFVVYDTETTGLSKADYVVQFSGFYMEYNDLTHMYEKTKELNLYIKPPFYMTEDVVQIHGLTNEFLADKPTEEEAFPQIYSFLNRPAIILGYHVSFDNGMMESMFKRQGKEFLPNAVIDVHNMVKEACLKVELKIVDAKLSTITKALNLHQDISFHSADDDVEATWRVAEWIGNRYIIQLRKDKLSQEQGIKKQQAVLQSGRLYGPNKYTKRVYCTILCQGKPSSLYYDIYNGCWRESNQDSISLDCLDMDYIHTQLLEEAKRQRIEKKILALQKKGKLTTEKEQDDFYKEEMQKEHKETVSSIFHDFSIRVDKVYRGGGALHEVNLS